MTNVSHALTGTASIGLVELVNQVAPPSGNNTIDIIKLLIQLAIGVATLIKLRKPRTPKNN